MNDSPFYSEPDEIDTDELKDPVASSEEKKSGSALAGEMGGEVVTGVIKAASANEEIDIIRKGIETADEESMDQEPMIRVAKHCHVGAVRDRNEDSCLVFVSETGGHFALMPFGLYIVADGMGGHANGHVASNTAARVAAHHIIANIYMPLLQDDGSAYQPSIQEVLTEAVQTANATVYGIDPDNDSGTTLTIALVLGRRLHIAHVGDSRIYLFSDGQLETISTDHSLVQRLQDVGQLTAEEATFYQYRHVLLRAVGQTEELEVDTYMRRLPKAGRLLLCSDGLPTMVSDSKIEEMLAQDLSVQEVADQLLQTALDEGGYDNITVILVDFVL